MFINSFSETIFSDEFLGGSPDLNTGFVSLGIQAIHAHCKHGMKIARRFIAINLYVVRECKSVIDRGASYAIDYSFSSADRQRGHFTIPYICMCDEIYIYIIISYYYVISLYNITVIVIRD